MRELLCTGGEGAQRWYRGWGDHPQSSSEEGRSAYTHHQAGPHNNNSIPNQILWEKGRILLQPPSLHFCKYWTLSILGKLLWIATFFAQGIIYEENTKNFAAVLLAKIIVYKNCPEIWTYYTMTLQHSRIVELKNHDSILGPLQVRESGALPIGHLVFFDVSLELNLTISRLPFAD